MSQTCLSPEELELALARQRTQYLLALNHDLRNPIAAQLNLAESLLEGVPGPLNDRQRIYVQRIEEKARLLLLLLGDIMELAGRKPTPPATGENVHPVQAACDTVVRLLNPLAAKKGKRVRLENLAPGAAPPPDMHEFVAILLNVCGEVIRLGEPGGELTLRIEAQVEGWSFSAINPGFRPPKSTGDGSQTRKANPEGNQSNLDLSLADALLTPQAGRVELLKEESRAIGCRVWLPHRPSGAISMQ